jgi:hypothetical protein
VANEKRQLTRGRASFRGDVVQGTLDAALGEIGRHPGVEGGQRLLGRGGHNPIGMLSPQQHLALCPLLMHRWEVVQEMMPQVWESASCLEGRENDER